MNLIAACARSTRLTLVYLLLASTLFVGCSKKSSNGTTPPPVVITADDPLKASVDNTIKPYPGVNATIQNGVITLTGEIKRADLQQLMAALNSLKPKSIDNKLTIKS